MHSVIYLFCISCLFRVRKEIKGGWVGVKLFFKFSQRVEYDYCWFVIYIYLFIQLFIIIINLFIYLFIYLFV